MRALLIVAATLPAGLGHASEPPAPESTGAAVAAASTTPAITTQSSLWYDLFTVHAFLSAGLNHTFERGAAAGRVFDDSTNSFSFDVVELSVLRDAAAPGEAGFRVDLTYGLAIPESVGGDDVALQQAYASYVVPLSSGVRLDAGTFVTPIGAEVIDGWDGYNDNYSRSFLFGYAIPFAHTGLRASYAPADELSISVLAVNGWAHNVQDGNEGKSFGAQVVVAPLAELKLLLSYMGGPEKPGNNSDLRHLVDVVAVLQPVTPLVLTLNGDYGLEENGAAPPTRWFGAAAVARLDVSELVSVAVRGEYFDDSDGFAGFGGRVVEATLTPTLRLSEHFAVRAEVRHDRGLDGRPFIVGDAAYRRQTTGALNALFAY